MTRLLVLLLLPLPLSSDGIEWRWESDWTPYVSCDTYWEAGEWRKARCMETFRYPTGGRWVAG